MYIGSININQKYNSSKSLFPFFMTTVSVRSGEQIFQTLHTTCILICHCLHFPSSNPSFLLLPPLFFFYPFFSSSPPSFLLFLLPLFSSYFFYPLFSSYFSIPNDIVFLDLYSKTTTSCSWSPVYTLPNSSLWHGL